MNIFNIPIKDINKVINQTLIKSTPEEVLQELIKCGYERRVYKMDNDENKDYNIPKYIDDFAESIEGGWWNYRLIEKESKWTDKNNKEHIDDVTKKQYTFKNIITYQVGNNTISGDEKGRQDLRNVGSGEGYYITNGYAIKIKWSKESRDTKTKYTLLDGTELKVSDGNTFIQIQPKNQTLTIEQNIEEKANQE